jgi:starch phosphorylase
MTRVTTSKIPQPDLGGSDPKVLAAEVLKALKSRVG